MELTQLKIRRISLVIWLFSAISLICATPIVRDAIITLIEITILGREFTESIALLKLFSSIFLSIAFVLCFIATIIYYSETISKPQINIKPYKPLIITLAIVCVIAFYPIFRSNFNYIDDSDRVIFGTGLWIFYSRYISEVFSHIIHTGWFLADISPLTQIISICILIAVNVIVISHFKNTQDKFSLWNIASVLPLSLCPYFLECISYKYDSPYMALSILASVLPILFMKNKSIIFIEVTFICTLIMCMTYQAASGIFPMLIVITAFKLWSEKTDYKQIMLFIGKSAGTYIFALIVFNIFMMTPVEGERINASIAPISTIIDNYIKFFKLLTTDFHIIWLILIFVITIWFIIASTIYSKQNKFISSAVSVAVLIIMLLLTWGVYPFLQHTLTDCRAMYGIGAFITFIGIANVATNGTKWITRILTFCISGCFIVFSNIYGNALAAQNDYINFRIHEVINDLTDLNEFNTEETKLVQFIGTAGYAPQIDNAESEFKILKRLVPQMFRGEWDFGQNMFFDHYKLRNVEWNSDRVTAQYQDWTILHQSHYHTIYFNNNHFIIELK